MSEKWEVKKDALYKPSAKTPQIVEVPEMKFAAISGTGNPNTSEDFAEAVAALYGLSYTIKMMPKKELCRKVILNTRSRLWKVSGMLPI